MFTRAMRSVIIHNIRSLYNVGASFRNCDAFGVDHLYLTGYTAAPPRPEIAKTALGACETVSWSREPDLFALIDRLQTEGQCVVAFESDPSFLALPSFTPPEHVVALFGNEPDGLPPEVLARADVCVNIPMQGTKTSLNISVAQGVALYALSTK